MKKKSKSVGIKQLGGFNIPPALLGLFEDGSPSFDQVMALAPTLDAGAGTTAFSEAFAQDDPSKIFGQTMLSGSMAQATQNNPLLTSQEIEQQAEDYAKKNTFLGIGKRRSKKRMEELLNNKNEATAQANQLAGMVGFGENMNNMVNASQLFNLFGTWLGQFGGRPIPAAAMMGYADNSPYKNMPAIDIPGNQITMDQTGQPLLAIPDKGMPKIMAPYSGNHVFHGASSVREVPIKQRARKGGRIKKAVPMYQGGGGPEGQDPNMIPSAVQLEKTEIFSTPELDLIDPNANEMHKDMDKDFITDFIRGYDYVFSDDPKMKITRKRAENMSLGYGPITYKEGEKGDIPEEMTIADLFEKGEKAITPAEAMRRVRKKYPMSKRDDMFSRKTNEANKTSRIPYMAAAVLANEEKRTKGKEPMSGFVTNHDPKFASSYLAGALPNDSESEYAVVGTNPPAAVPAGQHGGRVVPKGQFGLGAVGALANFATTLVNVANAGANKRYATNALKAEIPMINQQAATEGLYSDLSHGAQAMSLVNQDPTVTAPQYDRTQLDARVRRTPASMWELAKARIGAANSQYFDTLVNNAPDLATAVNAYTPGHAAGISAMADLGAKETMQNVELENQYRDMAQQFDDRQILADTTALNATRTNANALTGALGNTMGSAIGSRGRIASNRINALRQNRLARAQAQIDANAAMSTALANAGASAANTGYLMEYANKSTPVNNNANFQSQPIQSSGDPLANVPSTTNVPSGAYAPYGQLPEGVVPIFRNGRIEYVQIFQ